MEGLNSVDVSVLAALFAGAAARTVVDVTVEVVVVAGTGDAVVGTLVEGNGVGYFVGLAVVGG